MLKSAQLSTNINLLYQICFQCEAGSGSHALFDQLFHEPTKLIILGGGCSPPAQAIASTAHYWNLITVRQILLVRGWLGLRLALG